MSHSIRLIACDLDGTLLLNGAQDLNPECCGLIDQIVDRGIVFLAASGRQYFNLQNLFAPVKDRISYLCENGCLSYVGGKMINREVMPRPLGDEIIHAILARDGCEVMVSGNDVSYLQPKQDSFCHQVRDVVRNRIAIVPDITAVPEPYMKISVFQEDGLRDVSLWKQRFAKRCTVETGGSTWLDFMPQGVSKASALKKILAALQLSPADCIAFGDNENDREMLTMVGCPIVMNSAVDSIKPLGKYHTDTVEHALQQILAAPDRWL